ncbi:MAG: Stk1 family PASTA domain-containing Ser/Thr kinase [Firmicutes bacterium]|nr:Stk1 family PASTA domain-containing Ser/Thr kinase [Bacillota bacterium]
MANKVLAGRYELIEKIGEGGMAVVFKAKDRLLGRMVAIKILRPEYTNDKLFVESFRRESQIAANLVHPNIVNIYDVGKQGNIYYIVMELIEGEPLSDIIKKHGALEPRWACNIARQVASALAMAHKHHLIHRDIKPHNIMITSEGTAKITDFGIAKAMSQNTLVEEKEAVMGSVHYFSPEQARGGAVDERSDIYSLGIVLYEMLTAQVPYDGESAVEVAVKHMNEEMTPLTQIDPEIPEDLERIVMKAAAKYPEDRYRTAEDMITDLNFVRYPKHSSNYAGLSMSGWTKSGYDADAAERAVSRSAEDSKVYTGDLKGIPVTIEDSSDNSMAASVIKAAEEQKKKAEKAEKRKKLLKRILAAILAVLLAVPASWAINKLINGRGEKLPEEIELPSLDDMDYDEAAAVLAEYGITLEIQMELPSKLYDAGHIMSQSPEAGTVVKRGANVRVSVSKGEGESVVPDVMGKTLANARYSIEVAGYKVGNVTYQYSDDIPEGQIYAQSPGAGASLATGKSVDLTVSKGKEPAAGSLPSLSGMTEEEAQKVAESIGFVLEVQHAAPVGATYEEGKIYNQSPAAGQIIEPNEEDPPVVTVFIYQAKQEEDENGEESQLKTVEIPVSFANAVEDSFSMQVTVSHDLDPGSTTAEDVTRAQGSKTITVSGRGTNGTVLVRFGGQLAYRYTVDFESGTYTVTAYDLIPPEVEPAPDDGSSEEGGEGSESGDQSGAEDGSSDDSSEGEGSSEGGEGSGESSESQLSENSPAQP